MEYSYKIYMKVRDYECDIQGVVNNTIYQHYLEHARHEFFLENGINFAEMANNGTHLIVTRAELDYRSSLFSGDKFWVGLFIRAASRVRFEFVQDIYTVEERRHALRAKIIGTCLDEKRKPFMLPEIEALYSDPEKGH